LLPRAPRVPGVAPEIVELPEVPGWKQRYIRVSFETTASYDGSTQEPPWPGSSWAYQYDEADPNLYGYGPYDGSWAMLKVLPWNALKPTSHDHGSYTVVILGEPGATAVFVAEKKHFVGGLYRRMKLGSPASTAPLYQCRDSVHNAGLITNTNEELECSICSG